VRAYRVRYSPLGRRLKIAKTGLTNDLGEFRLTGLDPGDYYVSASYSERAREIPLFGATLTPNLSNPDAGFVTQYFPAATSPPDALMFTMVQNSEKTDLNFTLKDVEHFKVHVEVFAASNAESHQFNIAMMPEGAELEDAEEYVVHRSEAGADAGFEIRDVAEGHYSLVAFDKARILSEPTPITVNRDIDARVTVYAPVDLPGVLVDEAGNPIPGKWSVRLVRADPDIGQTIRADSDSGNFVLPDLGVAAYDVYVDGLPLGIYIKEVQFPVNDGPQGKFGRLRIEAERPARIQDPNTLRWRTEPTVRVVLAKSDLVVVGYTSASSLFLSPPLPVLRPNIGIVQGWAGAAVVLEPDRLQDSPYAFREDRFVTGVSGGGGFFRWAGVPPGSYRIFAFAEIPAGLYFDSQFNKRIEVHGMRVTITDGGTLADRIFELTGCVAEVPPYIDPIYRSPDGSLRVNPIPAPDANCLVPIPRAETTGVFQ
jgi:hypothetical protein